MNPCRASSECPVNRLRWRFLCAGVVAFALLLGLGHRASAQAAKGKPEPARVETPYRGGLVTPPLPKPRLTLTDTAGAPFDLWEETRGYVTLLFFGYSHCPDMCPIEMSLIARVLTKIPQGSADQFKVVFVTTDPARDSPKVLRSWLDRFDRRFIGLTGSEAAIKAAQVAANVPPAGKSAVRADGTYDVGHASFVLAYTKDNLAHVIYPVGVKQEDLAHDLPLLVTEAWTNR